MTRVAFELVASLAGTTSIQDPEGAEGALIEVPTFQGGVLATGIEGREDYHLKDELDAGDGVIVIDLDAEDGTGPALVELLDAVPALKRCAVPADRQEATVPELRAQLKALGLPTGGNKDELTARLAEATADAGDGDDGNDNAGGAGQED